MRTSLMIAGLAMAAAAMPRLAFAVEPLAGDPEAGHKTFTQICSLCHSDKKDTIKIGPPLYGAYGRQPGSYPTFHYSSALVNYGKTGSTDPSVTTGTPVTWQVSNLQVWEAGARLMIHGTKMSFPGLKTEKLRNDMIAYLQTLHD
jgi:cytochrome c